MVNRKSRQIVGHIVSLDKASETIQKLADTAPEMEHYGADGYYGYLDLVFSGKHTCNEGYQCLCTFSFFDLF